MTRQETLLSAAALALWSVWGLVPKLALQSLPPVSVLFYESLGSCTVALAVLAFIRFRPDIDRRGMALTFGGSAVSVVAMLIFFRAVSLGPVSIIVTLTAMYPVVSVLLAALILREKITRRQILAIALAMAGVALLAA